MDALFTKKQNHSKFTNNCFSFCQLTLLLLCVFRRRDDCCNIVCSSPLQLTRFEGSKPSCLIIALIKSRDTLKRNYDTILSYKKIVILYPRYTIELWYYILLTQYNCDTISSLQNIIVIPNHKIIILSSLQNRIVILYSLLINTKCIDYICDAMKIVILYPPWKSELLYCILNTKRNLSII